MNRREFLMWVGVGSLASSLPLAIAACSPQTKESESPNSPPRRSDGFQAIGTVAELNQKGQILTKEFVGGSVLVVSNSANPKILLAVNPTCTHRGCTVEWEPEQKAFVCPCHGAKYAPEGNVLKNPAEKPLSRYEAKIEGSSVLVKAN